MNKCATKEFKSNSDKIHFIRLTLAIAERPVNLHSLYNIPFGGQI